MQIVTESYSWIFNITLIIYSCQPKKDNYTSGNWPLILPRHPSQGIHRRTADVQIHILVGRRLTVWHGRISMPNLPKKLNIYIYIYIYTWQPQDR